MKSYFYLPAIAIILFVSSCKKDALYDGSAVNSATSSDAAFGTLAIAEHGAYPRTTDPQITTATFSDTYQYAYIPTKASARQDRLFIFIPGTFATSNNYRQILQMAAKCGYYSFGVSYDNRNTIEAYAGTTNDDTKAEKIFEEFLTGNDVSPDVNESKANGFENRIIKMIVYLDSSFPQENWKRFLTANKQIIWNKLSVAGHSQGADHTMYWSKVRNLSRASFFAGPYNFKLQNGKYPTWITDAGVTSPDKIYGFSHTGDLVRVYSDSQQNWDTLHLAGNPMSVDGVTTYDPSYHSLYHQLTTSAGKNFTKFHGYPVSDDSTPFDDNGLPTFRYVWAYMCFNER